MPYAAIVETGCDVALPLWRALRAAPEPLTVRELHLASRAHPNAIQLRLKRWERAGLIHAIASRPRRFVMPEGAPKTPPTVNRRGEPGPASTQQQRMWRAMHVLRRFTLPEVQMAASVTRRSGETFINALLRAGYIINEVRGNSRTGVWSVYRLQRRTGPKTPTIRHRKCADTGRTLKSLFDPNTGKSIDISAKPSRLQAQDGARGVNHVR